jgi:hypothetical protein
MNVVEQTLNFLRRRKRAYQLVFQKNAPQVQIVLGDLAKFCRATEDTQSAEPLNTAYLNGRRSVFLRLTQHLSLTPDELFLLYSNAQLALNKDTDNG